MAAGVAISLLFGPLLGDWRRIWLVAAALALLAALLLPLTTPTATRPATPLPTHDTLTGIRSTLKASTPVLLALAFAAYTLQYFAVLSFLPVFLMQRMSIAVDMAGVISAAVVASGILGNVLAAPLLARGIRPSTLIAATSVVIGLTGAGAFLPVLPAIAAIVCCFVFSAAGGIVPATLITCAPQAAPTPALAPLSLGLVMQGNYLGQVLGPMAISAMVGLGGWPAAAIPVLAAAACGVMLGLRLKLNHKGVHHAH
jgi:predicted MFS family arabinose efflux permease